MKGDADVIELLNAVLTNELTAINQYFIHSTKCAAELGIPEALGQASSYDESIEEMKHADDVIERILLLEGVPNMQRMHPVRVGETVLEQHQCDLALEMEAVKLLNEGVALCRKKADNGSRELLERILVDEEEGIDWIEAQLGIIEEVGVEAYLAEQIHGD